MPRILSMTCSVSIGRDYPVRFALSSAAPLLNALVRIGPLCKGYMMADAKQRGKAAIRSRCTRFLSSHGPASAQAWVTAMARSNHLALELDHYSDGPAIERLEQSVSGLLAKEAAIWFPKGVIAQQAALLVHAAHTRSKTVVLHPKSHIAMDEQDALQRLAKLIAWRLGTDHRHFTIADLDKITEPLAALTIELPLRRAGYQTLPWEDLQAIADWARERRVPLHLDGARLWEVQPWYGKSLGDIAAIADTVYVSLYKGLGGLGGCVLAGPKAVIEAAKPWRARYGGDLPVAFPMVITALDGLQNILPRMADYHYRACEIAAAIAAVPELAVFPNPPHCNSFQVHFRVSAEALEQASLAIAEETGCWLFGWFSQGLLPATAFGEIVVNETAMALPPEEIASLLLELQRRAMEVTTISPGIEHFPIKLI
jgi:threonine aldolase